MTEFTLWLLPQHIRTDDVGKLARAAAKSETFPRNKTRLHFFLKWAGEDEALRRIIKDAHREWRSNRTQA